MLGEVLAAGLAGGGGAALEEGADDGVGQEAEEVEGGLGLGAEVAEAGVAGEVVGLEDRPTLLQDDLQPARGGPGETNSACTGGDQWQASIWASDEADEGVAVAEVVVEEGEGVVAGQRGEPERELGEIDGHPVLIDAVEAALGDEAAGEQEGRLVAGEPGPAAVGFPGRDEQSGEPPHGLDEEGARAHGGVADLQREDGVGGGVRSEPAEDGFEGLGDDRLGERAGGVVGAGAAALGAGLEDERAGRDGRGGEPGVDEPAEGGDEVGLGLRVADGRGGGAGELAVGGVLEPLRPLRRRGGQQGVEADRDRGSVALLGPDGDGTAGGGLDAEAHDRLVHGADLLDLERAVAESLLVEVQEVAEDGEDGGVGDAGEVVGGWSMVDGRWSMLWDSRPRLSRSRKTAGGGCPTRLGIEGRSWREEGRW